jgi:hypothetical protein
MGSVLQELASSTPLASLFSRRSTAFNFVSAEYIFFCICIHHSRKMRVRDYLYMGVRSEYVVSGVACTAKGVYAKKKKWVNWSGDAFYDWHAGTMSIPPKGEIIGSPVETDISAWDDYAGEIPDHPEGFLMVVLYNRQTWDDTIPFVDLTRL